MILVLYGISNCDTVKKARTWLEDRQLAYTFHDYKMAGIDAATLGGWADETGWEPLLNRAGTTFKKLPDTAKSDIDRAKAIALMQANPSMIKRPVVEGAGALLVGFRENDWAATFG